MRVLISLLERFGTIMTFIVLQGVCFYLIVTYNSDQRTIYLNSSTNWIAWYHDFSSTFKDIAENQTIQDSLGRENALLREQISTLLQSDVTLRDTVRTDSLNQLYTFISAEVIKNSINLSRNFITIDKGYKDGVREHSGVITNKGVVGIVRETSRNYALVMSILNAESIVNAKVKNKGYFGPLVWKDRSPKHLYLTDIPQHAEAIIEEQDTVQTTGYSSIFPTNINIGVIEGAAIGTGETARRYKVVLFEDLANIQRVYVVNHLQKSELDSLENVLANE